MSRCAEVSFSLMGEDKAQCMEGVDTSKYLGSMLYRSDDDWTAVCRNFGKAHQV